MPTVDWRLLKSQYVAESNLNPDAVSPVGAVGIAQVMPGTWADVSRAMGWGIVSPTIAKYSILAGAFYDSYLYGQWSSPRPEVDRLSLMFASYNAGLGSLLKSQRLCGGALLYSEIIPCLPQVTGRNAEESVTYVRRIFRFYMEIVLG